MDFNSWRKTSAYKWEGLGFRAQGLGFRGLGLRVSQSPQMGRYSTYFSGWCCEGPSCVMHKVLPSLGGQVGVRSLQPWVGNPKS